MLFFKGKMHSQHRLKLMHFWKYFFLNPLIRGSLLLICGRLCRGRWLGRGGWLGHGGWLGCGGWPGPLLIFLINNDG